MLGLLNLAHGGFLVLAGFTFQAIYEFWPTGILPGFVVVPLVFAVLGWLTFRCFLQASLKRSSDDFLIPALLITLGLAFILEEGTLTLWDRSMAGLMSQFGTIRLGQIYLPGSRLFVLILMLAISIALQV